MVDFASVLLAVVLVAVAIRDVLRFKYQTEIQAAARSLEYETLLRKMEIEAATETLRIESQAATRKLEIDAQERQALEAVKLQQHVQEKLLADDLEHRKSMLGAGIGVNHADPFDLSPT